MYFKEYFGLNRVKLFLDWKKYILAFNQDQRITLIHRFFFVPISANLLEWKAVLFLKLRDR